VVGMTSSEARAKNLEGQGAEAVIVDVAPPPRQVDPKKNVPLNLHVLGSNS
jgi:hypothetical protein